MGVVAESAKHLQTLGIVLKKDRDRENHERLFVLDTESRLLTCYRRLSKKPTGKPSIDLFSTLDISLDRSSGDAFFVREYLVKCDRSPIGATWGSLSSASQFALFLIENLRSAESFEHLFELCETLFDALSAGTPPASTYLKGMIMLLRSEGYPVLEDWLQRQPEKLKDYTAMLLKTSVFALREDAALAVACRDSLDNWMLAETDLRQPGKRL